MRKQKLKFLQYQSVIEIEYFNFYLDGIKEIPSSQKESINQRKRRSEEEAKKRKNEKKERKEKKRKEKKEKKEKKKKARREMTWTILNR